MIGHPIGVPMGSDRPYPNRPRIAPIVSCRVSPSVGNSPSIRNWLRAIAAWMALREIAGVRCP